MQQKAVVKNRIPCCREYITREAEVGFTSSSSCAWVMHVLTVSHWRAGNTAEIHCGGQPQQQTQARSHSLHPHICSPAALSLSWWAHLSTAKKDKKNSFSRKIVSIISKTRGPNISAYVLLIYVFHIQFTVTNTCWYPSHWLWYGLDL